MSNQPQRTRGVLLALALAVSVLRVAAVACAATPDDAQLQLAFNTQNPRWEAPGHEMPRKLHKLYKPQHEPPATLSTPARGTGRDYRIFDPRVMVALGIIAALVVAAEWGAAAFALPATLFALALGLVVGPGAGLVNADVLFGNLLLPIVGAGLAMLLFDSALRCDVTEFGARLVSATVASVSHAGAAVVLGGAAILLLGLSPAVAILFGLILVIPASWPTQPASGATATTGDTLDGENALLAPFLSLLVILGYRLIMVAGMRRFDAATMRFLTTLVIGAGVGFLSGGVLTVLLRRALIPPHIRGATVITSAVLVFALANAACIDSGFIAVLAMGVWLARQERAVRQAIEGASHAVAAVLAPLLCGLLALRLDGAALEVLDLRALGFLGLAIVIARPLAQVLAPRQPSLTRRARIASVLRSPGGAVGLAFAAIFALRLVELHRLHSDEIATLAVLAILGQAVVATLVDVIAARTLPLNAPAKAGVAHPTAAAP